jgi:hypothetical protein
MANSSDVDSKKQGFLSLAVLRDILIVGLLIIVGWKVLNSQFSFNLAAFSFTDFLNLVLALFSVALSVAFYFKATEASNQFYDNTYKFTKDMSEILGRIEAGFGERLRHLDEGYSGVRERLDKMPAYAGATHSQVKDEEAEILKKEAEQKAVIEELAEKAKLAEHEKQSIFSRLAKTSTELEQARAELRQMRDARPRTLAARPGSHGVLRYLAERMKSEAATSEISLETLTSAKVRRLFSAVKPGLAEAALKDMKDLELLDEDGDLTTRAMTYLRELLGTL